MIKNFNELKSIQSAGFTGFFTIGDLMENKYPIPKCKGVYLVLFMEKSKPVFLTISTGPKLYKKVRDINVSVTTLKENWVDKTLVLNIGKAGGVNQKGEEGNATLRSRLRQYLSFGKGKDVGHLGGRFIWQLANSRKLILCWKETPNEEPANIETKLIADFTAIYSKRPFANLKD